MNPILINTGRSTSGWSFWGPAFSCDFLWFLINVKGKQFIGADPLTQGSMGHTILAHYYARLGCEHGSRRRRRKAPRRRTSSPTRLRSSAATDSVSRMSRTVLRVSRCRSR